MTVMVEKRQVALKHVGGVHPDIEHLPLSVLDGLGDHVGDLDMAGKVAAQVYNGWDNDGFRNALILSLIEFIETMTAYHRAELQAMLNKASAQTITKARRAIVKAYVTDVLMDTVGKSQEIVSKDTVHVRPHRWRGQLVGGYDQERARGTGPLGTGRSTGGHGALSPRQAVPGVLGYDESYEDIPLDEQRRQGSQMAAQILNAYASRQAPDPEGRNAQAAEFTVVTRSGEVKTFRPKAGELPRIGKGDRVVRTKGLGIDQPINLGGDVFNVAQALGASAATAGSAGATAQAFHDTVNQEGWGQRLIASSEALHHMTGGHLGPPKVQAAVAMGKLVGKHGPEVTRVLGPHMRRYTYKYRGTMADPTQWTSTARLGRQSDSKGEKEPIEGLQRKLSLSLARDPSKGGLGAIPTEAQNRLMLKTGNTPPSHGYIVDKTGVVKQQAQGYADDHYVPFNLRELHALNGGSYTRSRAFGGPTTEDIALAMKTGTDSFETISRNGIYRVQFTKRNNSSGRKVGAWAKDTAGDANEVMVNRYGRLLDAIKHGKVTDPETNESLSLNGRGYEVALQTLQKQFPYYVKKVEFTPASQIQELQGLRASEGSEDTGYIRPYYLKPSEAVHGYYDDLLGGNRSYDQLDQYRLGKARTWYAKSEAERAAREREAARQANERRLTGEGQARRGHPWAAGAPNAQAARIADAARGDFGPAQRSTPATQTYAADRWTDEQTGRFLGRVHAFLDHIRANDPDADILREKLGWVNDREKEGDWNDFYDAVKNNIGGTRNDIFDTIGEYEHLLADNKTGLEMYHDLVNNPYFATEAERQDPARFAVDSRGSVEDLKNSEDGRQYAQWVKLQSWKKTGRDALGPDKMKIYDHWMAPRFLDGRPLGTLEEHYAANVDPETGLTDREMFENQLDDAEGRTPRHTPRTEAEALTESTGSEIMGAQRDDESDEEYARRQEKEADDFLRGVRPEDR